MYIKHILCEYELTESQRSSTQALHMEQKNGNKSFLPFYFLGMSVTENQQSSVWLAQCVKLPEVKFCILSSAQILRDKNPQDVGNDSLNIS